MKKPLELVDFGELGDVLRVEEQPLGSVVANKYVRCPIAVQMCLDILNRRWLSM